MPKAVRCLTASAVIALALLLAVAFASRPAQAQPTPAVCRIGVNVEDLYDLDMARDTFGAILWLWSVCPSLDIAPLGAIAFPTASASLSLTPIETVDLASGGQYASRRVRDMTQYPFDRQHVVIAMDEAQYGRIAWSSSRTTRSPS